MFQLIWIIQTKVNDLDVVKLKFFPKDLKKIGDIVDKEVVKKTVYNTLNAKVNNLEKKRFWCIYFDLNKSIQHR